MTEPAQFDFSQVLGIADALPMLIAYVDADLTYRFVNKSFAEFFGRPRGEILGRSVADVLGAEAYAAREPMLRAALAGERQWFAAEFEHEARGPLALQTEYIPQGAGGRAAGFTIIVQDVTEQRVAERSLRESEARFRRIADSAPAIMWVTRLDRTRDFVNQAYCDFCGLSAEAARTQDWREFIHADDFDRIVAESVAGEATLKPFTLEARYRRGDGAYRWLRSVSSPRFGPDGELIGFIGVAADIHVSKQSEMELKALVEERTAELAASEAQFRAVFEAALEVMVLLRPDGTVIAVNNRREAWRHPDPRQAIGMKLWDAPTLSAYPQHVGLMRDGIAKAATGETFTTEVMMERAGTPTAYLDVSVQPVRGHDGGIVYLLFEARDITDLKHAQEQLRQSQKMEALGQLTGGIAHDFNNLLTVVVGGLDLIVKTEKDERLKRYATNALTAAERGARLTAQLLAFSRVQKLEVRPTYVAPLIEAMRPMLKNVLGPEIEKRFELQRAGVPVMADPTQLELAVLNLAINARDAMPDGGVLTFKSARRSIDNDPELEDGDYIELAVSDTGTGMDSDTAARAFEPFFTTKEVGKGTGLGLSMVYGVARQSGGTARIDSSAGKGTTIRLFFRCAEAAADAPVAAASTVASEDAASASILIVDDDPDVRAFMAASLADFGYSVRQAADGDAGLKAFARKKPDLVILDFAMPGMTGGEVAARMRTSAPGQPILFVSGYSESEAIRAAAPDAVLLAKPFRPDALDAAVRETLSKGKGRAKGKKSAA